MEQEAEAPRLLTRDSAVTSVALALVVALSWAYLLRAPRHPHEMTPLAAGMASVAAPRPMAEEAHPAADDAEEDDVPRFP